MFNVIDTLGTVRATAATREAAQAELDDLQIRTGITFLKVVAAEPTGTERQADKSTDPEPWRCVDWQWISNHDPIGAPCRSAVRNRHNCQYDPRPTP